MSNAACAAAAVCLAYTAALAAWPWIRQGARHNRTILIIMSGAVIATLPFLLLPPGILRALAAIACLTLWLRIYSFCRAAPTCDFATYTRFLASPWQAGLTLTPTRSTAPIRRFDRRREALRLLATVVIIPATWCLAERILWLDICRQSWLLNHIAVVLAFVVITQSVGQATVAVYRLAGRDVRPLVDNILLSRTPAEFWRRWSWPIHTWLYWHVYLPAQGRRRPVRATLLVFLVSGMLHEILAYAGVGRVTWHQTLFFTASAVGVIASLWLTKLGSFGPAGQIGMRTITLTFMTGTASFMFITFNYIFRVYHKHIFLMW